MKNHNDRKTAHEDSDYYLCLKDAICTSQPLLPSAEVMTGSSTSSDGECATHWATGTVSCWHSPPGRSCSSAETHSFFLQTKSRSGRNALKDHLLNSSPVFLSKMPPAKINMKMEVFRTLLIIRHSFFRINFLKKAINTKSMSAHLSGIPKLWNLLPSQMHNHCCYSPLMK